MKNISNQKLFPIDRKSIKMKKIILFFLFIPIITFGQDDELYSSDSFKYKEASGRDLKLYMFKPEKWKSEMNYPSIVFYFGGGLSNRNLDQMEIIAKSFCLEGFVSFVVDYRVKSKESVTAKECISDAQDSFAFIRKNADLFGISKNKITAFGYSSGGYLSAALGTLIDKKNNSLSRPNFMVLLAMGEPSKYRSFGWLGTKNLSSVSTIYNINKNTPPTLLFVGESDGLRKYSEEFNNKMIKNQNFSELVLFKNKGHSFNMRDKKDKYFNLIFDKSLEFLNNQFLSSN